MTNFRVWRFIEAFYLDWTNLFRTFLRSAVFVFFSFFFVGVGIDIYFICKLNKNIRTINLTHISLASFLWDIGKQGRSRPDAAELGVWSGSPLFAYRMVFQNLNKNKNYHPVTLTREVDWSYWQQWEIPFGKNGLNNETDTFDLI